MLLIFMQVVSSAIVDKYIGESARLIREMFGYAKEHQPCIIFMDEIDAIGGRRFSEGTSADREIQRTLMELLSQLDGFDVVGKVSAVPHVGNLTPGLQLVFHGLVTAVPKLLSGGSVALSGRVGTPWQGPWLHRDASGQKDSAFLLCPPVPGKH